MKKIIEWVKHINPRDVIIVLLLALIASLLLDLRIARNNERELSRRNYELYRKGVHESKN